MATNATGEGRRLCFLLAFYLVFASFWRAPSSPSVPSHYKRRGVSIHTKLLYALEGVGRDVHPFLSNDIMNADNTINALIRAHRWTEVLEGLAAGEYGIGDVSDKEMESLSSVAYRMNARGGERKYRISLDYANRKVLIRVN